MFGTVRKHQNLLWYFIIAIIIVSFVFLFSPNANMDLGRKDSELGSIKGKDITREEFVEAYKEMRLFYRLRFGEWPGNEDVLRMRGFDIEQESYTRLLLNKKMDEMNVHISPQATGEWISNLFKRGGSQGGSVANQYEQFVKTQLEPNGITAEDFERFARHEVGNQHLVTVFGASGGLVSRAEAEENYKRENENMLTEVVFFTSSNFLSKVKVDDEALNRHFDANKPAYRIPDKVQADYVSFSASNYLKGAEEKFNADTNANLNLERVYFARGGTNTFKDDQGNSQTIEQAKPALKKQYLEQAALDDARKRAAEFISQVDAYKKANPAATDALAKTAAASGLKLEQSPLFDISSDAKENKLPYQFKAAAFKMKNAGEFNTSPVVAESAAYVLSLKQKVEGKIPEFAAVKNRVAEDYKKVEAAELARKAAEAFQQAAAKGLAEKKSFESLLVTHKAQSVTLSPFNMSTQNLPELAGRVQIDRLKNATTRLSPAQVSDLLVTENGAAVVYLRERRPVDQQKLSADIEDYIGRTRDQREYAAYAAWRSKLSDELELKRPTAAPAATPAPPQRPQAQR